MAEKKTYAYERGMQNGLEQEREICGRLSGSKCFGLMTDSSPKNHYSSTIYNKSWVCMRIVIIVAVQANERLIN